MRTKSALLVKVRILANADSLRKVWVSGKSTLAVVPLKLLKNICSRCGAVSTVDVCLSQNELSGPKSVSGGLKRGPRGFLGIAGGISLGDPCGVPRDPRGDLPRGLQGRWASRPMGPGCPGVADQLAILHRNYLEIA